MQIKKIVVILAFLLSALSTLPISAQGPVQLEVLQTDASGFPEVRVDVVVRQDGRFVPDLDAEDFSIDDAQSIDRVTTTQDAPIVQLIIIDPGYAPDLQIIRNTALALLDERFVRPGDLIVLYIARSSTSFDRYEFTDAQAAEQELLRLNAANAPLNAGETLNRALQDVRSGYDLPVQALYIGSFLFARPTIYTAAEGFRQAGVPLHAVQTSSRINSNETSSFSQIAELSGGLFVENTGGRLTDTSSQTVRPLGSLLTLYETMQEARTAYQISYTASAARYDVRRNVNLGLQIADVRAVSTLFTYEPAYQAPSVEIIEPESFDLVRTSDPSRGFDVQELRIVAQISYPDGVERPIETVSLRVIDSSSGEASNGGGDFTPEALADNQIAITWNLRAFLTEGTVPLRIELEIRDALGLTASDSVNGSVTVAVLQPTLPPTQTPTPSLVPLETLATVQQSGVQAVVSSATPAPTRTPNIAATEAALAATRAFDTAATSAAALAAQQLSATSAAALATEGIDATSVDSAALATQAQASLSTAEAIATVNAAQIITAEAIATINAAQVIVPTEVIAAVEPGPQNTDPSPAAPLDEPSQTDEGIVAQLTSAENMPIVAAAALLVGLVLLLLIFFIVRGRRSASDKGAKKTAGGGKGKPKGPVLPGGDTMISDFSEVRRAVVEQAAKQAPAQSQPVEQGTAIFEAGTALYAVPDVPQPRQEAPRTRAIMNVVSGMEGASPVIVIDRGVFIIGRTLTNGCHYAINNKFVSSPHITIENREDRFFISDDNSKNGTFVDDIPLSPGRAYPLNDGARIVLGRAIHIEFHIMPGESAAPKGRSQDIEDALRPDAFPPVVPAPAPDPGPQPAPPPAAPPAPRDADATMIDSPALRPPVQPPAQPVQPPAQPPVQPPAQPVQPPAQPPVQPPAQPPSLRDADATMIDAPALRLPVQPPAQPPQAPATPPVQQNPDFEIPNTEPGNWDVDTNLDDDDLSPSRRGRPLQSAGDDDEDKRIDDNWADET